MSIRPLVIIVPSLALLAATSIVLQDDKVWDVHDMNRPQPAVVTPGTPPCEGRSGTAPSDAIALFDGTNLDQWRSGNGPAGWTVANGIATVKGGDIQTKKDFNLKKAKEAREKHTESRAQNDKDERARVALARAQAEHQ